MLGSGWLQQQREFERRKLHPERLYLHGKHRVLQRFVQHDHGLGHLRHVPVGYRASRSGYASAPAFAKSVLLDYLDKSVIVPPLVQLPLLTSFGVQ